MKNALINCATLTIDLSTLKPYNFYDIPYTKFEHFGIIRFELCCGQTNRQTNKQTETNILPMRG